MPVLVLWLNIDFSVLAEAALNLGSCPLPCVKQMPRSGAEQQWLALPPALVLPGGLGKGARPALPIYTAVKAESECSVLGGKGGDMHTFHSSWSKTQDSQAKEYKKRISNILINLQQSRTNTTASVGLERPGQGVSTRQTSVTTQIPCTALVQQPSN